MGRTLSELVDALPAHGLKALVVAGMRVSEALPAALFDKCAEAEDVTLYQMALKGRMSSSPLS